MAIGSARAALALLALIPLGACAHDDEFAFAQASAAPPVCEAGATSAARSPIPGFGCATDAILRAMVLDDRDLAAGREMAAPGGDAALAAVRRYRAGEVKAPVPATSDALELTVKGEK